MHGLVKVACLDGECIHDGSNSRGLINRDLLSNREVHGQMKKGVGAPILDAEFGISGPLWVTQQLMKFRMVSKPLRSHRLNWGERLASLHLSPGLSKEKAHLVSAGLKEHALLAFQKLGSVVAEVGDEAAPAFWPTRLAGVAPQQDEPVVGMESIALGHQSVKPPLHLKNRSPGGDLGSVRDAKDVGIDGKRLPAEGRVQDHIGRLTTHARQRFKRLSALRDFAAMPLNQEAAGCNKVLALGPEESDGLYEGTHAALTQRENIGWCARPSKKLPSGQIDRGVRGLGREHDGHQELKWGSILKLRLRVRVLLGQS